MLKTIPIINTDRSCDGCTKCCEGFLSGQAYGYTFYPGKPCHFIGKSGCKIYEYRPHNPCVTFKCAWKYKSIVPEWMKPNEIDMILVERVKEGISFLDINPASKQISIEVLNWAIDMFVQGKIENIRYWHNNEVKVLSKNEQFIKIHSKDYKEGEK